MSTQALENHLYGSHPPAQDHNQAGSEESQLRSWMDDLAMVYSLGVFVKVLLDFLSKRIPFATGEIALSVIS